jgi:preprotein translocase subunit YajC
MRTRIATITAALVLGLTAVAAAGTAGSGTVVRIDPQQSVIVLDDGRMYRVTPSTVLIVDNRPATVETLRPGQHVVIQSGEVVTFRDGRAVTVAPAPAPPVVAQLPPPPPTVVPAGVRQTIYGTVEDVDGDGEVKIKTQGDSFEIKVAPEALRQIKKGDNVVIDLMITPPGAPAASPSTR